MTATAQPRRRGLAAALLAVGGLLPGASPALAADVPGPTGGFAVQTGGLSTPLTEGDWYTAAGGGAGVQRYRVDIPCDWPAGEPIYLDLFSPEINLVAAAAGVTESRVATADSTFFRLLDPAGSPLPVDRELWQPSAAGDPERWFPWGTLNPVVCGAYTVVTAVVDGDPANLLGGDDDQNGWQLRIGRDDDIDVTNPPPANYDDFDLLPGTGDEITVGVLRGAFQHDGGGTACFTLHEYVAPGTPSATFHNFGLGGAGAVTYYAPSDAYDPTGTTGGTAGTVSAAEDAWNGGTSATRGGDSIGAPEAGWWRIVTCAASGNQLIQEGQQGVAAYVEAPPVPSLSVTVDDGQTLVTRGQALAWTATVSNAAGGANPGSASDLTLTAPIPASLTGASCAVVAPATGTCTVSAGTATATLTGQLDAGASAQVTISGTVSGTATGSLVMAVSVAHTDGRGNVFPAATASDTDPVRTADLTITLLEDQDPAISGGVLTYTATASNAGPDAATSLELVATVPAGLTLTGGSGAGWSCSTSGPTLTCTRPSLAASSAAAVTFTAAVTATTGTVSTTASVTTTAADPTPAEATEVTTVQTVTDLRLAKTHIGTFQHGQLGFYQLTATNDGPSPTSGQVSVVDTLPAGLAYVSATGSGWLCSAAGQVVTCDRPAGLASGESSSFTIFVDVTTATASSVTNTASVSGPDSDPDPSNNGASDPTPVETASIGDLVWDDLDGDGARQAGEPGLAGLAVTAVGPVTRSTTTSSTGSYRFVGLVPGTYTVTVTPPAKYAATTAPHPRSVVLVSNQQVDDADFGFRYVNTPPTAVNDTASTPEESPVTVDVLANDTDDDSDTLTVVGSTDGASGSVTCSAVACVYTPALDAFGTDTFTYTVSDDDDGLATATVTVTITAVNDAPVFTGAAANTAQTVPVGGTLSSLAATDVDADPLGYALVLGTLPPGVLLNGDGSFTGGASAPGAYSVQVEVTDGNGGTDVTDLAIQVGGPTANTPPDVGDDAAAGTEDTSTDVGVLANDSDVDLDPLVITGSTDGAFGSVACDADSCVYTPDADRFGTDVFTYTVSDGTATSSGTVTVTVAAVNDAPVFTSSTANTAQTVPVGGTLSSLSATDVDLDPLSYSLVGGALPPGVTLNGDGSFSGGASAPGAYSVQVQVTDGNGGSGLTDLAIQVGGPTANTPPEGQPDTQVVAEDASVTSSVVDNDTDADLDPLVVTTWSQGSFGSVSCSGGSCTYTPNANFFGSDTYTYTVTDGIATDVTSVAVTVNPVNDAPAYTGAQRNTSQTIPVGGALQPLQATDIEGDALSFSVVGGALPGGITLNGDGSFAGTATGPGTFSAQIQVTDGTGTALTTLQVGVGGPAANTPPVAASDTQTVLEDATVTTAVAANDTDVDLDPLVITSWTQGSFGSVSCTTTSCTYTPTANVNGGDSYTYTISDGIATDTGVVSVTVTPVNDAPVAGDDARATPEDTPRTMTVLLGNDTDVDGDPLSITAFTQPAAGTVTCGATACTFTPGPDFVGTATFTYTVSDGAGGSDVATVTMTVTPVNDAPVAVDDAPTVAEDGSVVVPVTANDTDVEGDPLAIFAFGQGAAGTVSCGPVSCTYTPDADFTGTDVFTYTVADGQGGFDDAVVTVTVTPVNDPPVAGDDGGSGPEDTPITVDVLADDTDVDGDPLAITGWTDGASGTVTCAGSVCTYTPGPDFAGTDSFTYTISDGAGGTDTATVTITVGAVNDAPVAVDDTMATSEDNATTLAVVGNDTDVEGTVLTITGWTGGTSGTVTCGLSTCTYTPDPDTSGTDSFTYTVTDGQLSDTATVTVTVTAVNDAPLAGPDSIATTEDTPGSAVVLANDSDVDGDPLAVSSWTNGADGAVTCAAGTCTYTPNPDFNGADSFTYTVSDGAGGSAVATVSVTVTGDNDPPVAVADALTTDEDSPGGVAVLANDSDVDGDPLVITSWTDGASGVVSCTGATCTYTPAADFAGTDSFTYTISDGAGGVASATVTVTVTGFNDAPTAAPDVATTAEDTPVVVAVLGNDTDPDADPLTISSWTQGSSGSVSCAAGTCTYTPAADFAGTDSFTYTISDGAGGVASATVTVTVAAVNDPPVARPDTAVVVEGGTVVVPVLGNDTDADGDPLSVSAYTQPAHGTVSCTLAGVCTYVSTPGFSGPDSFTYTVSDGAGGAVVQTVRLTVRAAPAPPPPPPPPPPDPDPGPDPGPVDPGLPVNGAPSGELVALAMWALLAGVLLQLAGAAIGRPRRSDLEP